MAALTDSRATEAGSRSAQLLVEPDAHRVLAILYRMADAETQARHKTTQRGQPRRRLHRPRLIGSRYLALVAHERHWVLRCQMLRSLLPVALRLP